MTPEHRSVLAGYAARSPSTIEHDVEVCGRCLYEVLLVDSAKEVLRLDGPLQAWHEGAMRRWREGKFFKLWTEEAAEGRDPAAAFTERGWTP